VHSCITLDDIADLAYVEGSGELRRAFMMSYIS
jgi:hypothetical protein